MASVSTLGLAGHRFSRTAFFCDGRSRVPAAQIPTACASFPPAQYVIDKAGEIDADGARYLCPRHKEIFTVDHVKGTVTGVKPAKAADLADAAVSKERSGFVCVFYRLVFLVPVSAWEVLI